ncbi:hypothetical protein [Ottowia sp.]|uniref:hypothetical protein n=1 Tax=Ottowia sp. TaxID=1898956 RepID=UPI002BC03FC3|nr:hypothetical protein [Ottowia sp.]HPZ57555.1 hypothetical protein [Ottowia sp.]HQD49156.1 hypothetical protein [Ottowia sp.]
MSLTILFIGALHAIPSLIGAFMNSRLAIIVGAMIGAVIAFAFGSGRYVIFDLVGVGIGTYVAFQMVRGK